MNLWNKLAQDVRMMWVLTIGNGIQFIIILSLITCLALIPTRFTFHIPPDLSNGATLQANEIPNAYVGSFTFYIWQALNNWQSNGSENAFANLHAYGAYLTPSFRDALATRYKRMNTLGELSMRVRTLRQVSGDLPKVEKLGPSRWQVTLTLRDSEYVNGVLVKDKDIKTPFLVERYNANAQSNPYGLVIAGFTGKPLVIKVMK